MTDGWHHLRTRKGAFVWGNREARRGGGGWARKSEVEEAHGEGRGREKRWGWGAGEGRGREKNLVGRGGVEKMAGAGREGECEAERKDS